MNKKGFTLIELLAVITILSIILTITIYSVKNILGNSKESLSDSQKLLIIEAAKVWYLENMDETEDEQIVTIEDLVSGGYIESSEVKDPKTGEEMIGCVVITVNATTDTVTYEFETNSCTLSD